MSLTTTPYTILLPVILLVYVLIRRVFLKTSFADLPGPKSPSFLYGHIKQFHGIDNFTFHLDMPKRFGRAFKFYGMLGNEELYVTDSLALYHIAVKDQDVYEETTRFIETNRLIFGHGLLGALGDDHKRQRKMLNPFFSTAHLKALLPVFYAEACKFRDILMQHTIDGPKEIDMRHWSACMSLECIGQAGFGYSFNSFENVPNEFRSAAQSVGRLTLRFSILRSLAPYIRLLGPPRFRRFVAELIPWRAFQELKSAIDSMHSTSLRVYEVKKRDEVYHATSESQPKDIIGVLLRANRRADAASRLEDHEMFGQMSTLLAAGTHTTSGALVQLFYLLACHPEVQAKLRAEIIAAQDQNDGDHYSDSEAEHKDVNLDRIMALPYLDAIIRETLRLYAPVIYVARTTRKAISLPLSQPILSTKGTVITSIPIKPNTNVIVGTRAVNRDPAIWGPDAEIWTPERWLSSTTKDGKAAQAINPMDVAKVKLPGVYSGMMTFWGGSRSCIGFKFSEIEIKVTLSLLIQQFQFSLPDGAPTDAATFEGINRAAKVPLVVSRCSSEP